MATTAKRRKNGNQPSVIKRNFLTYTDNLIIAYFALLIDSLVEKRR